MLPYWEPGPESWGKFWENLKLLKNGSFNLANLLRRALINSGSHCVNKPLQSVYQVRRYGGSSFLNDPELFGGSFFQETHWRENDYFLILYKKDLNSHFVKRMVQVVELEKKSGEVF